MKAQLAIALLVGAAVGTCAAQEQSLGDVARQQKSSGRAKAVRVVTDENLPHASPSEAMNGAVVSSKAADKQNAAGAKPAGTAATTDTQKRADELKAIQEAAQRAIDKFQEELKNDSVSAERRELFEEGLKNAKDLLAQASVERERIEQAVTPTASNDATKTEPNAKSEKAVEEKSGESKTDTATDKPNQERKD